MKPAEIPKSVPPDAGFWIGLCHAKDEHHSDSKVIYGRISQFRVVMPWPLFYEVLRTRHVRQPLDVAQFQRAIGSVALEKLDDSSYREDALNATFDLVAKGRRISLVDAVLRAILQSQVRIDYLVTYNVPDFADVCGKRRIPLISGAHGLSGL